MNWLLVIVMVIAAFDMPGVRGQTNATTSTKNTTCVSSGVTLQALNDTARTLGSPTDADGEYPSNKYCRWFISAANNNSNVEVNFTGTYGIEFNRYCSYDHVTIYDGRTTSISVNSRTINKVCGTSMPTSTYRSSGQNMTIVFVSDYTIQDAGFTISYISVSALKDDCFSGYNTVLDGTYQLTWDYWFNNYTHFLNFTTNGYPNEYGYNFDQYWLLTRHAGNSSYTLVLEVLDSQIERSYGCIYDRFVIYNGPCIADGEKTRYCTTYRKTFYLDGDAFLLHFHSDNYYNFRGIQFKYYAEENPDSLTTTTTTLGPPVAAVVEAIKEALVNYTDDVLPTRDLTDAIVASVDFYLVGINGLDEVEQMLTTTVGFEVNWIDSSLTWEPTKRNGITRLLLPQNDLWKPDIALLNGFTKITAMGASFMYIDVNYNGSAIWKPYQILESTCQVDMTHYPYDRQTCTLQFGTWSSSDKEIVTELGRNGLQKHVSFQEHAEWSLVGFRTVETAGVTHSGVTFRITIERNPRFITFYLTIPTVMLAFLNIFTFVIPTESGEKSGFSITIFLSFVVVLIVIDDTMPENSDSISLYAAYALAMTIFSAIALIISVIQIRALTFDEQRYPIALKVQRFVRWVFRIRRKVTCSKDPSTEVVNVENDTVSDLVEESLDGESDSDLDSEDSIPARPTSGLSTAIANEYEEERFTMSRPWRKAKNKINAVNGFRQDRPMSREPTNLSYNNKLNFTRTLTTTSIVLDGRPTEIMNSDPVDPEYENVIAPPGSVIEVVTINTENNNVHSQERTNQNNELESVPNTDNNHTNMQDEYESMRSTKNATPAMQNGEVQKQNKNSEEKIQPSKTAEDKISVSGNSENGKVKSEPSKGDENNDCKDVKADGNNENVERDDFIDKEDGNGKTKTYSKDNDDNEVGEDNKKSDDKLDTLSACDNKNDDECTSVAAGTAHDEVFDDKEENTEAASGNDISQDDAKSLSDHFDNKTSDSDANELIYPPSAGNGDDTSEKEKGKSRSPSPEMSISCKTDSESTSENNKTDGSQTESNPSLSTERGLEKRVSFANSETSYGRIVHVTERSMTPEEEEGDKKYPRKRSVTFVDHSGRISRSMDRAETTLGSARPISRGSTRPTSQCSIRPVSRGEGRPKSFNYYVSAASDRPNSVDVDDNERVVASAKGRKVHKGIIRKVSFLDEKADNGDEEEPADEYAESEVSIESSMSAKSVKDDDDKVTWADIVSCSDTVMFIVYLFVSLVLTMALFLTSFYKGDDEVP